MICRGCGRWNPIDSAFCKHCGWSMNAETFRKVVPEEEVSPAMIGGTTSIAFGIVALTKAILQLHSIAWMAVSLHHHVWNCHGDSTEAL